MPLIYCVEDDDNIRDLVVYTLGSTGFSARGFADGEAFFAALKQQPPDLVLLDVMLPGEGGLSILARLRAAEHTRRIPVVMLTARGSEYDKVSGLDRGADDYVTKPFGMMELISRIRAVLRRAAPTAEREVFSHDPIVLNTRTCVVEVNGSPVDLTPKEFELLRALLQAGGAVITRDALLTSVWGYDVGVETRTLDVHIRSLRQKLGTAGECVETVRGFGYRLAAPRRES